MRPAQKVDEPGAHLRRGKALGHRLRNPHCDCRHIHARESSSSTFLLLPQSESSPWRACHEFHKLQRLAGLVTDPSPVRDMGSDLSLEGEDRSRTARTPSVPVTCDFVLFPLPQALSPLTWTVRRFFIAQSIAQNVPNRGISPENRYSLPKLKYCFQTGRYEAGFCRNRCSIHLTYGPC